MHPVLRTVIFVILALSLGRPASSKPSIWFCPLDPLNRGDYSGAPGYMNLFTRDAHWSSAASKVSVFKIYPQWIDGATDDQLKIQFADLKRRKIKLALEFGVLSPTDGWMSEGYGGQNHHLLLAARRINSDGGTLSFVAMDEPMYFGTVYRTAPYKALTVTEMVDDAAANIKEMWSEFPDVQVGDIEPLVSASAQGFSDEALIARYDEGIKAFGSVLGRPLAFFDADLDWHASQHLARLAADYKIARANNVPFGVIYNGDGSDTDNSMWMSSARWHMSECEAAIGSPQIVIFQSWNAYPQKLLPEADRSAFTSLIDSYFNRPTRLDLTLNSGLLRGRLFTKAGVPVDGAKITITLRRSSSAGSMATYFVKGATPTGAKIAVLGVRVNNEGSSVGICNIRLAEMKLSVVGQLPVVRKFSNSADLNLWPSFGTSPDGASTTVDDGTLLLTAKASQSLLLNSEPTAIAKPGLFRFEVQASVPSDSVGNGYFTVVFLGDRGEIKRFMIPFDLPPLIEPTITTSSDGRFQITLPSNNSYVAECRFDGNTSYWPTKATATGQ